MSEDALGRAIRRLPSVYTLAVGAMTVGSLSATLVLALWGHPTQRFLLLLGCLAVAVAGLAVLVVNRVRTRRFTEVEVVRYVLERPASSPATGRPPGDALPATLPRERHRALLVLSILATATWLVPGFFLLAMADTRVPQEVERLREAGGVVATLPVESARVVERTEFDSTKKHNTLWTQRLELAVPDSAADADRVLVQTHGYRRHSLGDEIRVIYAPGDLAIEGYAGPRERGEYAGGTQGYPSDLDRLLAGRALSHQQLAFGGVAWLVFAVAPAWVLTRPTTQPTGFEMAGSRAIRATFRSGRLHGEGLRTRFHGAGPDASSISSALEGRTVWLCWDPRRGKTFVERRKGRPTVRGVNCPAVVIFDNDGAVYGHVRILEPADPGKLGVAIGGDHASTDPARQVRIWTPRILWPLTTGLGTFVWFALGALTSAVLFSDLVSGFFPRLGVGALGAALLSFALACRFAVADDQGRR